MKTTFFSLLTGLGVVVLVSGCQPATTTTNQESMSAQEVVGESFDQFDEYDDGSVFYADVALDAFDFGYSQDTIVVTPGEVITVELTSSSGMHDFVIDELNVRSNQITEGESDIFTISIPDSVVPGTEYEFYCSIGDHRARGMVGKLIVQ